MPGKSKTFGSRPTNSIRVRVQTLEEGRIVKTKSYAVYGASQPKVEDVVEAALSGAFAGAGPEMTETPTHRPVPQTTARRTGRLRAPQSIDDVIAQTDYVVEEGTFDAFVRFMRANVPSAQKNVGVFTKMGVQEFQNWQLDENPRRRLTDAQLLAAMRAEFPLNDGKVFTGNVREALRIVSGIRAHYNRDGHHGPSPRSRGLPLSQSYGRFAAGDDQ